MTADRILARAEDDIRRGDVAMARTRLRDSLRTKPQNLEARELLAEVYRLEGDDAQAGRWSYLSEHRSERELDAFRRAYRRNPRTLMRAIDWCGDEQAATTQLARDRLADLRAQASAKAKRPVEWGEARGEPNASGWSGLLGNLGCALVAVVALVIFSVGIATIAEWIGVL